MYKSNEEQAPTSYIVVLTILVCAVIVVYGMIVVDFFKIEPPKMENDPNSLSIELVDIQQIDILTLDNIKQIDIIVLDDRGESRTYTFKHQK